MIANANAPKGKVKLTFHHGAQLSDPKKLFNASLAAKHSVRKSKGSRNN